MVTTGDQRRPDATKYEQILLHTAGIGKQPRPTRGRREYPPRWLGVGLNGGHPELFAFQVISPPLVSLAAEQGRHKLLLAQDQSRLKAGFVTVTGNILANLMDAKELARRLAYSALEEGLVDLLQHVVRSGITKNEVGDKAF